jgi:hypothetical protein
VAVRRVRIALRHAGRFLKCWNRPADSAMGWLMSLLLLAMAFCCVAGWDAAAFYYGILFFALVAVWTCESVKEYRKGLRQWPRD